MGDNAEKTWEWHNTAVGVGYQAKGVMRQPCMKEETRSLAITDMRGVALESNTIKTRVNEKIERKKTISNDQRKKKNIKARFNPILQELANRLKCSAEIVC
mmetsp:Transcript_8172/g.13580  ORF Transcript_8172/g.13580 Transcript_8172/m.13580 type:complete len:101 (+) Transcript_8172:182-484(+)